MNGPQAVRFADGRLHLHHGPIDLIVEAFGPGREGAYAKAAARFETVLEELVPDLPALRTDIASEPEIRSAIGQAMAAAVRPFPPIFITPMAAVAGAVADAALAAMREAGGLDRAYVNNGGDVALWLAVGQTFDAAVAAETPGRFRIQAGDGVGGVATSGWRGRSQSLGVADFVTVLARTSAEADAAATLIANAVDLPDGEGIERKPARAVFPDSDLGDRLVTTGVAPLAAEARAEALAAGVLRAEAFLERGLIAGAALGLQGEVRVVDDGRGRFIGASRGR